MPAILSPLWTWDELEPVDEFVDLSSGYIHDPDHGSAIPQRMFVWRVERARDHVRDIHIWLSVAFGFGPGTVWAQQRAAYEREFAKFLKRGRGSDVLWCVAQPVRRPIRERLRAANFEQTCSTPERIGCPDALRTICLGVHPVSVDLRGFVFDGVSPESVVTTVGVRRAFPSFGELSGDETWCCLTSRDEDLDSLGAGVVPGTRPHNATLGPHGRINRCAIFTLVRTGPDRALLRFAAQLAPRTGATIDLRAARVPLEISLRMDEKEDYFLRRAHRLPPVPPDHEHSRLAELHKSDSRAVETAWRIMREIDRYGAKEQVEALQLCAELGSLNQVAGVMKTSPQTIQARLDALTGMLEAKVYGPRTDQKIGGSSVTPEGAVLLEALRLFRDSSAV